MPITALPALDRTSATFKTDADTFFGSQLPAFAAEANALQTDVNAKQVIASAAAVTATAQADLATTNGAAQVTLATAQVSLATTQASTATTQASIATTQAGIATTKASEANTSAGTATTQAGIATTQAGVATTKAGEANTSAIAAAASAASISSGPVTSVNAKTGVVSLVKADVGLGSVDNTADASKPVSTATQTALNLKQNTLVSGTDLKTVNGNSLLGSGNLLIAQASFVSANQTIVLSSKITIAHGLGTSDLFLGAYLKCVTADAGYSVGDIVLVGSGRYDDNSGVGISADATNVYLTKSTYGFQLYSKTTGGAVAITPTSWRLIAKAWK